MWQIRLSLRPATATTLTPVRKQLVCERLGEGLKAAAGWVERMTHQWQKDQRLEWEPEMHLVLEAEGDNSRITSWPPVQPAESPPPTTTE